MKERINRLAKGIIDSELPKMTWSPDVIEETVRINGTVRRELFIASENGLNVKGFVYSSNARVRIPNDNNTFGGLRNHILYEVDTSFLAAGDEIEGSFYLVTNCGEKEIPYLFYVDLASSGRILGDLHTAEDFLKVAEHDMETALRLLEYQDFAEAPFMQDLHVRAIYDGLKGHGNRQNFMEEFLVALGVKKSIRLMVEDKKKVFENPSGRLEDAVVIRSDSWGYIYMEVTADGDFIHLPKKSATQADFADGVFRLPFCILSERLHAGRNYGTILIKTAKGTTRIPVEAVVNSGKDAEKSAFREEMKRYLDLRLEYESGMYEDALILNQMQKELNLMRMTNDHLFLPLLEAEIYVLTGRQDKACLVLDEVRDKVLTKRLEDRAVYCFYQYLQVKIWNDKEQRDSLIRLLQRYCSDGSRTAADVFLYLMLLKVNEELFENPATVLISMEQEFKDGCCSPFLYVECLKLLEQEPAFLKNMGRFELHALYFGARKGMIGRELALAAARAIDAGKSYRALYLKLLCALYGKYQETPLLSSVCTMLIRGNLRGSRYFEWYERAIQEGISLTRLYEYFLYSLPKDYGKLLPREVLLYFSYATELDTYSRSVLYQNILLYAGRDSDEYRMFERAMEQFAMEQLFAGRINSRLAVIYKNMLYPELIDGQLARALPGILRSNRITCRDASMRYVVVRHEELMTEDAYPLGEGTAYVPLFSERDVIQFQDSYGNRYMDIRYEKAPAMDGVEELVNSCFEMYPSHPALFVNACCEAMKKENLSPDDAALLEQADQKMKLHPLFKARVLSAIVRYYKNQADEQEEGMRDNSISYLLCLDKDSLTREERNGVCETLIRQNYYNEAYDMLCRYGAEGISVKRLLKLCTKMVLQKLFDEDDRLLHLAYDVFLEEKNDSVILDYLCEHYNGTVDQMYRILMQGLKEHVETYDLEERLVAQMLFTGNTEKMDKVFELYASRKKTSDNVVRAYFTIKSADYFLLGRTTEDKVFAYLEGAVNNSAEKDKVSDIYLLALTKYYSTLPELSEEQRSLCQSVVDVLIESGMVFSYFKDLAKFILIPGNILDKEIIEYHGSREVKPYLRLRILPEEEEYHYEEMRPIYKGIYIREKVLFEGELMEYQIEEERDGERTVAAEGSISCKEVVTRAPGNRFACLNEMSLSLELKNETALREKMEEYLKKDAAVAALFTLQ